jgi:hypothetical protein
MKTKLTKILGVVLSLALLSSLAMIAVPVSAAGDPDVVNEWENLNMPMLNRWTDVKLIEQAEDGTIFISVAQYFPGDIESITGSYTWDVNGPGDAAYQTWTATGDWDWWWDPGSDGTYGIAIRYYDSPYLFDFTGTLTIDWEGSGDATLSISGMIYDTMGTSLSGTSDHSGTITSGSVDFYKGYVDFDTIVHSGLGTWTYYGLFASESMYKSADGYMWEDTCISGGGEITAIEPSDNYSEDETVYVAIDTSFGTPPSVSALGWTTIYRCTDAADEDVVPGTMGEISAGESGTRDANYVYSLDSYYDGDDVWLLAATNIDVFAIPDDNGLTTVWTDMELSQTLGGNYSDDSAGPETGGVVVFKSMFAPDFASSGVIWALYWDMFNTNGYGLIARSSGSTTWGTVITPEIIDAGGNPAKTQCDMEFEADYSSNANPDLVAALSFWGPTSADDIYSIECNFYGAPGDITPFDVDPGDRADFCSVEVSGNMFVAGIFDMSEPTTEVWYSHNDGITWNEATKNPTGRAYETCNLLWSTAGSSAGAIFAATGGQQSGLSISEDDGVNWTQIAFIDDDIASIRDLAFDPTSTSALMVTSNSASAPWPNDSLWKTSDVTAEFPQWQRVFCEDFNTNINFNNIEYSMDGTAVMVFDRWAEEIFRSSDGAMSFVPFKSTAAWGDINDWAIYDSSSVYAACDNGFWSTAVVGSDLTGVTLVSVALQTGFDPDDPDNGVLVVGDDSGNVYVSYNAGDDIEAPVNVDATSWPVHVAFGSDNTLYLTEGDDVYYAEIGATNVEVDTGNILGGTSEPLSDWYVDIEVASDDDGDIVYALNNDADMARYLVGDYNYGGDEPEWDIVWNFGGSTHELWVTSGSNTAWTIDTSGDDTVNLIDDTLTGPVTGLSFSDIGPFSFVVSWDAMTGATDYEIVVYLEEDSSVWADAFVDTNSFDVADEWGPWALPDATEYIVQVRVNNDGSSSIGNEIEYSRWSAAGSVMTDYYMTPPIPTNPAQGADEVSLTPSFGWSMVKYAVTYTFELSDDPTFSSLIDSVAVTTTAYSYVGDGLDYDSDYYWRVRAVAPNGTTGPWSTYTETYFHIDLIDTYGYLFWYYIGPIDGLFEWISGAISNFHTEEEEFPPVTVEPQPTPTIDFNPTIEIPEITLPAMPDITIEPPAVTVPITSTVTTVNPVIELPDQPTPVYIWAIVAIGAVLTIAVIILIIRTRRVV